jgi:hypothetical protein
MEFEIPLTMGDDAFFSWIESELESLAKARRVAAWLGIDPIWTFDEFEREGRLTAAELHAILFESGWSSPAPHIRMSATCKPGTLMTEAIDRTKANEMIRIIATDTYTFFNEKAEVGRLVRDFTFVSLDLDEAAARRNSTGKRKITRRRIKPVLKISGTERTVMTVRFAQPGDENDRAPSQP